MKEQRSFKLIIRSFPLGFIKAAYNFFVRFSVSAPGYVDQGVVYRGIPLISLYENSSIKIGERSVIISASKYTALGVRQKTLLRTLAPGAVINIGEDVGISGAVICAMVSVSIGDRCLIGSGVKIFDNDFHPVKITKRRYLTDIKDINKLAVTIEDDVFLGTDAIICKGVRIGSGSVVAAGSVVVNDVPPRCIVGGNPSKIIGTIC